MYVSSSSLNVTLYLSICLDRNYEQIVRAQSQQVRGMGGVMRSSQQIPNDIKFKLVSNYL